MAACEALFNSCSKELPPELDFCCAAAGGAELGVVDEIAIRTLAILQAARQYFSHLGQMRIRKTC